MHILFLTDNFPPECNAPATRTYEHAQRWISAGHQVTVVTCWPNFPGGEIYPGYKNKWFRREVMDGIDVIRVKTFMTANERFLRRIFDYVSFMITGSLAALFVKKPDVVMATSPQFFCGIGGMLVSMLKRKPFILEIRDLWPESIVALGVMKDRWSIRLLEKIETFMYRQADAIIVVTPAFVDEIVDRGGDRGKITVVLNGVEREKFQPREKNAELVGEYGLSGKFIVGYIGTHGLAHDLSNVVEAAKLLTDHPNIHFLFVGSGAARQRLVELTTEYQLDNVSLIEQQPRSRVPEFLALCDISLIPLRDEDLFKTVIPSKIFECMSMGVPMLASLPSGVATGIILDSGSGVCTEPGNPIALADKILELASNRSGLLEMSESGQQSANLYTRERMAAELVAAAAPLVD